MFMVMALSGSQWCNLVMSVAMVKYCSQQLCGALNTWKLCKTAILSSTRALSFHNVALVLVLRPIFSAMICCKKIITDVVFKLQVSRLAN